MITRAKVIFLSKGERILSVNLNMKDTSLEDIAVGIQKKVEEDGYWTFVGIETLPSSRKKLNITEIITRRMFDRIKVIEND